MPSIDRLPSGKFRVRHQGKTAAFATRSEAEDASARMRLGISLDADLSALAPSSAPTLGEALPGWLAARTGIQPDTAKSNESQLRIHVMPTFHATPLDRITREEVGVWQARLEQELSAKSVRNVRSIFRRMLKDNGFDPFQTVRSPRLDRDGMLEIVALSLEDVDDIVRHSRTEWAPLVRLLGYSGLRLGEALAIKNTDLRGNILYVERALKNGNTVGAPKTGSSRRSLTLDSKTVAMLKQRPVAPGGWLFAGPRSDAPASPSWYRREVWEPATEHLEQRPRTHDLRHNHAANLLDSGVALAIVSARLGHSDQNVTLRVYNRLRRLDDSSVLDVLEGRRHLKAV